MPSLPSIAVFEHPEFRRFWIARQFAGGARQMLTITIAWQVYDVARRAPADGGLGWDAASSAFLIGFVGLAQFLPILILSLVGGTVADRMDRKRILLVCQGIRLVCIAALVVSPGFDAIAALAIVFTASVAFGSVNAFFPAAANALYPTLVSRDILPKAVVWNSIGQQFAMVAGPAVGGLLLTFGEPVTYGTAFALSLIATVLLARIDAPPRAQPVTAKGTAMMIEGLRYIWSNKVVFGAISLDFVVVFFAGSIALLPVFARDILGVGEEGFGILRAAPAIGAALVALLMSVRPIGRRIGPAMFIAVFAFGVAIIVFGLSRVFWVSVLALIVHGAADMFSVYIRQSLIQLSTPDAMKGRVSSVSFIFIAGSNELGEFQSGVAARLLGPVYAVLVGGVVAIVASGVWLGLFPALRRADRFEDIEEQPGTATGSAEGKR